MCAPSNSKKHRSTAIPKLNPFRSLVVFVHFALRRILQGIFSKLESPGPEFPKLRKSGPETVGIQTAPDWHHSCSLLRRAQEMEEDKEPATGRSRPVTGNG